MLIKLIPVAISAPEEEYRGTTAIVFDVLRATSTITTALANGYQTIYPVVDADEAAVLAQKQGAVLAGERGGEKIPGFSHGNSPLEFSNPEPGKGSILVLTTSNGTGAINKAAASAKTVLIGSLLNARSVAHTAIVNGNDITLVCAGTGGKFSLEDTLGAGFVLTEIIRAIKTVPPMDDLAAAAYGLARFYGARPLEGLKDSAHGKKLLALGRNEDLAWCARLNMYDLTPVFNGKFVAPGNFR